MSDFVVAAAVAGPLITAVGLIFVYRGQRIQNSTLELQLRQAKFNSLNSVHQELNGPDMQRAMRYVIRFAATDGSGKHKEIETDTEEKLEHVELVLRKLDLLGHRLQCGVLPREETLQTEWIRVATVWPILKPYVERIQKERRVPYKQFLQWLATAAETYQREKKLDCSINYCPATFSHS